MKKIFITFILIFLFTSYGLAFHFITGQPHAGGAPPACSYDYCQDFEEATEPDPPTGWTDTSPYGTINWDQSTGAINGTYSAQFDSDGDNDNGASAWYDFGPTQTTLYAFLKFKITDLQNNYTHDNNFQLRQSSGAGICKYYIDSTNHWGVKHGTATDLGDTQLVQDQLYYLWLQCTINSGGNTGVAALWLSTTGTKPGTPEATTGVAGTDTDTALDTLDLRVLDRDIWLIDDVYLDTAEIGNQ